MSQTTINKTNVWEIYFPFFNDDLCLNNGKKSIPNSRYFIGLKEDLIDLFEKIINFNTKMNNSNILHDLCKYGYKNVSWVIVLLPFFLYVGIISSLASSGVLYVVVEGNKNKKKL